MLSHLHLVEYAENVGCFLAASDARENRLAILSSRTARKVLLASARRILYTDIFLEEIDLAGSPHIVATLAHRPHLATLVRRLTFGRVPETSRSLCLTVPLI